MNIHYLVILSLLSQIWSYSISKFGFPRISPKSKRDSVEVVIGGEDIANVAKYAKHRVPELAGQWKKIVKNKIIDKLQDDGTKEAIEKQSLVNAEIANMIATGKLKAIEETKQEILSSKSANKPSSLKSQINDFGVKDYESSIDPPDSFDE
ncbi:hypothetical protein CLIB1444_02S09912 [[Candida] jaroonii]|uniref:Uncharacterized protein n=1 Tax=[Candida] jaroonii TaxID=467808 RepID=A0ACA9Y3J3_9ASCO|nr:hypothetical protein CLIB1444_02S09912 [[Candida] jaroonii]